MFGECRELEEMCGVTDKLLKGELRWGRSLKEEIRRLEEDSVMGHLLSNHCRELGLAQETDWELLLCLFVDLDINFFS